VALQIALAVVFWAAAAREQREPNVRSPHPTFSGERSGPWIRHGCCTGGGYAAAGPAAKKSAHWEIKVPWLTHILDIAAD